MKKGIAAVIIISLFIPFIGCKEDMPTMFSQNDGIYFNASSDSLFYTFAKYPSRLTDTIKLPVSVLGNSAAQDREIMIEPVTGSGINGVLGTHYKLLTPYKFPANNFIATLPIVVYRTPDMDSVPVNFVLKLSPNASFNSGITSKSTIKINLGYLQKPPTWGEIGGTQWAGYSTNFGTWTKTKYKVILDALYDPASDTTVSEFPYSRFGPPAISIQYLQLVKNYIRTKYPGNYSTPVGIGATLRDPDANNNVIQVGPANY
jgi:hypothetical protein